MRGPLPQARRRPLRRCTPMVSMLAVGLILSACSKVPGAAEVRGVGAAAGVRRGGELRIAVTEPGSLDPAFATTDAAQLVLSTMCQPVISLDAATGEARPGLARRIVPGGEGSTASVLMRKNARFPDGSLVTSSDVVAGLKRLALPANASPYADLLADVAGYEKYRADVESTGDVPPTLAGARVVAPDSFELGFAGKDPDAIKLLSLPMLAVIEERAYNRDPRGQANGPSCYGPYQLAGPHHVGDSELVLTRNPGFAPGDTTLASRAAGFPDRIVFKVLKDGAGALQAYRDGLVDLANVPPDLRNDPIAATPALKVSAAPAVEYLGVVVRGNRGGDIPATTQAQFRTALSLALDRSRLVADVYHGTRTVATGIVPPAVGRGYDSATCRSTVPPTPDLVAAKQLLDAAGVDAPRKIKLAYNDEFQHAALVRAVADQWRSLGVDVEPTPMQWDEYIQAAQQGRLSGFRVSWSPPVVTQDAYLAPLLSASRIGTTNLARYDDPSFDEAVQRDVRPITDDIDRERAYRRLEAGACSTMPLIPVAFSTTAWLVRPGIVSGRADGRLTTAAGVPLITDIAIQNGVQH